MDDFVKHLSTLLSRECLENEEIQQAYEEHMINSQVRVALDSLLTKPFDTLVTAIRREFKEERVGLPMGIKISKKHIDNFLESISDESGRIPVDLEAEAIHDDSVVEENVAEKRSDKTRKVRSHGKRVTIGDLLREEIVRESDQWRLTFKGEVVWGRIEANGQLEVNSEGYGNPSKAFEAATSKGGNGWYYWQYRNEAGDWRSVGELRNLYREKMARKSTLSLHAADEGVA